MTDADLPKGPITDDELTWLRRKRREEEHARWAMRLFRRWAFYLTSAIAGLYGLYEVAAKYLTFK